jgi:hypothetical protein
MNTNAQDKMFILNDAAKNDPAVQLAIQAYTQRLQREEEYRAQVRAGLIQPQSHTVWNISDRH